MNSILLLTGPPCSGKSTVGRLLAKRQARGVHIISDDFYSYVCNPVSPYREGSHDQNTAVIRAAVTSAASFAQDDFQVVLDGVFGSWYLPLIGEVLHQRGVSFECVALDVELSEALTRLRNRSSGTEDMVISMHDAFAKHPLPSENRVVTTHRRPEEIVLEIESRRSTGKLGLAVAPGTEPAA